MPQAQSKDRRRFERIPFDHAAALLTEQGLWPCELLDISFRGALLGPNELCQPTEGQQLELVIPLDDAEEIRITMSGTVVRASDQGIALSCDRMDIDSMSLLRRLVEMNLGDTDLLERELSAFID